ncbi:MAG: Flp pilus assembly complex ATPase component TadA [Planctomycetales bacterium]|nr:Flp pilus assembly complex ATPase component TadA [Planctomycetales bacterium]
MSPNQKSGEKVNVCTRISAEASRIGLEMSPESEAYATLAVDRILKLAVDNSASDIHLERHPQGISIRMRIGGRLIDYGTIVDGSKTFVLARIKALASLVTYRVDKPQEGRMVFPNGIEARVSTLPTLHGERAVIRVAARQTVEYFPSQLGLPNFAIEALMSGLELSSGVILFTGVAGAGKTTCAYASLRWLVQSVSPARSIVSLEDPIEAEIRGVSQSQISTATGYCWSDGLKAILRQDAEVLLIGEIRDAETAKLVFQAAMTGQLVISTMHARTVSDALRRLLDMQVPVHHLYSCLEFLCCQKLDPVVATDSVAAAEPRRLRVELLPRIESELAQAIMAGAGSREIELAARMLGMTSWDVQ